MNAQNATMCFVLPRNKSVESAQRLLIFMQDTYFIRFEVSIYEKAI